MEITNEIQNHVSSNRLFEAIGLAHSIANMAKEVKLENKAIGLNSQLSRCNSDFLLGHLKKDELNVELNRIIQAILDLVPDCSKIEKELKRKNLKLYTEPTPSSGVEIVGKFPHQVNQIAKAIANTKHTLTMVVDYPAYGCFSNPEGYLLLKKNLLKILSKGVFLRMYIYDNIRQTGYLKEQFAIDDINLEIKPDSIQKLSVFENKFGLRRNAIKTYQQLFDEFKIIDNQLIEAISGRSTQIFTTGVDSFSCIWLMDNKEALFSLYRRIEGEEVTFKSSEPVIINFIQTLVNDISTSTQTNKLI